MTFFSLVMDRHNASNNSFTSEAKLQIHVSSPTEELYSLDLSFWIYALIATGLPFPLFFGDELKAK